MRVTIRGVELRFWFQHHSWGTSVFCEESGKMPRSSGSTLARSDKFCKAVGRRVSLTKLLRSLSHPTNLNWTRADRGLVWAEYFKQHRDLRHD